MKAFQVTIKANRIYGRDPYLEEGTIERSVNFQTAVYRAVKHFIAKHHVRNQEGRALTVSIVRL